jgi:hypothetical protein
MRHITMLILILPLCACVSAGSQIRLCEEITALQSQMGTEINREQFLTWITETFQISRDSIEVTTWHDDLVFSWQAGGVMYSAETDGAVLADVAIYYKNWRPEAAQFKKCLGDPSLYKASYQLGANPGNQLSAQFLYPLDGILISGARFLRFRPVTPPAIRGDFPMSALRLTRPGSSEDVLSQIYGGNSGLYEEMLTQYKPWPGGWDEITIDIDTSLLRES